MDVKSFSDGSFDPVSWINKSFAQIPDDGNRESHASGLVYKLQLFLQEINNSLEETAHVVIRSLPFVLKQAESLEEEVHVLKKTTAQMHAELHGVQDSESVEQIRSLYHHMERLQSRLEAVKQQDRESAVPSPVPVVRDSDSQADETSDSKELI